MKKGQSLLEVAIFGAIIIMLLGILVNYGLRYNYQQQAMQQAFRKSLAQAANQRGVSVSNVVVTDKHIPNPSDTFGVGSVNPFSGSAGAVIRDYQMAETPDLESELPRVTMNINGEEFTYKTAGIREEFNVPESNLGKYQEIYGSGNVWSIGDGDCLETGETSNPETGEPTETCLQPTRNIRIIDSAAGEIIDYGSAVRQCRMIVDEAACVKECERGKVPGSPTDCNTICGQSMNVPWYCAGYSHDDVKDPTGVNHAYIFPVLNELFSFSALKTMGLQQDYEQVTTTKNTLRKTESASGITTTDNLDWKTQTKRKIVTKPYGSTSNATDTTEVTSEVRQKEARPSQTTDW